MSTGLSCLTKSLAGAAAAAVPASAAAVATGESAKLDLIAPLRGLASSSSAATLAAPTASHQLH